MSTLRSPRKSAPHGPLAQVNHVSLYPVPVEAGVQEEIRVGTERWHTWLEHPGTRSFSYRTSQGTVTFRKEPRKFQWFWYAYREIHGRVQKAYAGKSEHLTGERLQRIAEHLTTVPSSHLEGLARQPGSVYFPDLETVEQVDDELFALESHLQDKGTLSPQQRARLMQLARALAFDLAVARRENRPLTIFDPAGGGHA